MQATSDHLWIIGMAATTLPAPTTAFVGRNAELEKIARLLDDPACRLLTLTGPGGIGKTRLALEAARAQAGRFGNGVWFVALQPLASGDLIVPAIAEAIQLQFLPGGEPAQQLFDYLSDKSVLLVLDNFEHLLDGAALVSDLLAAAPALRLLATSRERLNLVEEWALDVTGLSFPAAESPPELGDYDAVRLFTEHARRVQVGFTLTPDLEPAVARICRLVDGMPLGIELAAAWVRALSCAEIAAEIERGLDVLTTSTRNVAPRHRNMRAVLDQSWNLLTVAEQHVFQALSVFRGGFRKEAAREVAGASLPMLSALVDKSLLRGTSAGRYEVHELLRQYAEEKLREDADYESARDRHSRYYADFMRQRADDLKGRRQIAALDEIEADFENVRTGWEWAVERQDGASLQQMMESLCLYCDMRSRFHEGMVLFWQAQARFDDRSSTQAEVLWASTYIRWVEMWRSGAHVSNLYESVRRQVEICLAITQRHGQTGEVAFCLWALGVLIFSVSAAALAKDVFEQSLALYTNSGDRFYVAKVADFLAISCANAGDVESFSRLTRQSLDLRREIGDLYGSALSLNNFVSTAFLAGDHFRIEHYLDQTDAIYRETNSRAGIARNDANRAWIAFCRGDFDAARTLAENAAENAAPTAIGGKWLALAVLSLLASRTGDYARGLALINDLPRDPFRTSALALAVAACGLRDDRRAAEEILLAFEESLDGFSYDHAIAALSIAAILLAREGEKVRATETMAMAFTHPVSKTVWMENMPLIARARADLQTGLAADIHAAAWTRGQTTPFNDMIALLIPYLKGTEDLSVEAAPHQTNMLSEREREILRLIAEGRSNREIADQLFLAVGTVKWYVSQICSRLGAANRVQAIARARDLNLLG